MTSPSEAFERGIQNGHAAAWGIVSTIVILITFNMRGVVRLWRLILARAAVGRGAETSSSLKTMPKKTSVSLLRDEGA